jgi:CRP-like cAMP-binding protein
MTNSESYLRAILGVVARYAIPPDNLASQVGVGSTKSKQIEAYNLCDGSLTQSEIAAKVGLDAGNFSRTMGRWADDGLVVRVEINGQMRPIHLYPIPAAAARKLEKGA